MLCSRVLRIVLSCILKDALLPRKRCLIVLQKGMFLNIRIGVRQRK